MSALYVAWRPADDSSGWRPVGKLWFEDGLYFFCYTKGALQPGFNPFPGLPDVNLVYESSSLFPLFANRLLSTARPDYRRYLEWSGFTEAETPDPILILGVTEGMRRTDYVEVFPVPQPNPQGLYRNRFFLHGIRWLGEKALELINDLREGQTLKTVPEPNNAYDPRAVALIREDSPRKIGYVPRYFARDIHTLTATNDDFLKVTVLRVNHDAPLQSRVLCQVEANWPKGFKPCADDLFRPIADLPIVASPDAA